jgi:hypothetical protein
MGCSRSGHHAMMNWIIKNLVGFECNWHYKMNWMAGTDLFHLGEANHDIPITHEMIQKNKDRIGTLFVAYEDTPNDYTVFREDRIFLGPGSLEFKEYGMKHSGRILFIRNFYNNLSSRLKSNEKQIFSNWKTGNAYQFDVGEKFIYRWKSQARAAVENKISYLRYEDFLNNKEVREKFLWDNFKMKDVWGTDSIYGTVSSFGEQKNYENRHNQIEIPDDTKELIRKDNELHYLIGKLNYEYREI